MICIDMLPSVGNDPVDEDLPLPTVGLSVLPSEATILLSHEEDTEEPATHPPIEEGSETWPMALSAVEVAADRAARPWRYIPGVQKPKRTRPPKSRNQ